MSPSNTSGRESAQLTSTAPGSTSAGPVENTRRFMLECIAGCAGGAISRAVGHPLDTVKVLVQTRDIFPSSKTLAVLPPPKAPDPSTQSHRAPNSLRLIYSVFRNTGGSGFFRGLTPPIVCDAVANAALFGVYKHTQKYIDPAMERMSVMIVTSALAGLASLVPSVPVEVIKVRMQLEAEVSSSKERSTVRSCVRKIYRESGLRGFYRGGLAQGLLEVPSTIIFFPVYDMSMRTLERAQLGTPDMRSFLCGGFAGCMSTLVLNPCDVVKTRLQSSPHIKNVRSAIRELRTMGIRTFWLGWHYNTMAFTVISAVQFIVYEKTIHLLDPSVARPLTR